MSGGRLFRLALAVSLCMVTTLASPPSASATEMTHNEGLFVTPIRQYITIPAGTNKQNNITVANYTRHAMTVSFSVKQFSVADYSYDFQFNDDNSGLIGFNFNQVTLKPGENKVVPYQITIPVRSPSGGEYYTLFATANGQSGNSQEQVQATTLLYLTISGQLIQTSSLRQSSLQRLVFGSRIPFSLDIADTGNVHYFAYVSASLQGPWTSKSTDSETHLVLPATTRHIPTSLPSPVLPGIYRATYGYRTTAQSSVIRQGHVVYVPPWSIAVVLLLGWAGWFGGRYYRRHRRGKRLAGRPPSDTTALTD